MKVTLPDFRDPHHFLGLPSSSLAHSALPECLSPCKVLSYACPSSLCTLNLIPSHALLRFWSLPQCLCTCFLLPETNLPLKPVCFVPLFICLLCVLGWVRAGLFPHLESCISQGTPCTSFLPGRPMGSSGDQKKGVPGWHCTSCWACL